LIINQPIKIGCSSEGIDSLFLNVGEFFFTSTHCQLHTILGSCIAITLWHPKYKIGGMCHFVLPGGRDFKRQLEDPSRINGRYSDSAMALFERDARRYNTKLSDYQAKIFGGSNMLTKSFLAEDDLIGNKNTKAAINHLSERNIPLMVANVGETGYRRIVMDVASGDVWVKHEPIQKNIPTN